MVTIFQVNGVSSEKKVDSKNSEVVSDDVERQGSATPHHSIKIIIKDAIFETLADSKTHGLSNIFKNESIVLKIIWMLCLLASAGYCLYELVIAVITYLQYSVFAYPTTIYEAPTMFPAVDICNLLPLDTYQSASTINTILAQNNISSNQYVYSKQYTDIVSTLIKANTAKLADQNLFDPFANGYNLEDMLVSCFYEGQNCTINDFYYYNDFNYGNCFSFNLGTVNGAGKGNNTARNILKGNFPGPDDGLQLELYVRNALNQQYSYKNGIRVTIHNQSLFAFPKDSGISVATGFQTDVIVRRSFLNHLNQPFSNCLIDPVDYTQNSVLRTIAANYSSATAVYQQAFCLKVCLQQYIIQNCNCYDLSFPFQTATSLKGCYEIQDLACIAKSYLKYINNDQDTYCYSMCPLECTEIQYDFKVLTSSYPTQWYSSILLNNSNYLNIVQNTMPTNTNVTLDYNFVKQNTLLLNIYYDKMEYVFSSEIPQMTIDALIATFGGNMGLFLGMTVLSFIEFVEILFNMIYKSIKNSLKKRQNK